MLFIAILLMLAKDYIAHLTGVALDNASISLATATLALFIFNKNPKEIYLIHEVITERKHHSWQTAAVLIIKRLK